MTSSGPAQPAVRFRHLAQPSGGASSWLDWQDNPGELRFEPDAVILATARRVTRIPRWKLRAGFRLPNSNKIVILLVGGGRMVIEPEPGSPDVLSALGLADEAPMLEIKLQRLSDVIPLGFFAGVYSLVVTGVAAAWLRSEAPLLLSLALSLSLIVYMARRRVVVGAEGVLVRNGFRERFVSFADVDRVDDLTIWLRSGKRIRVSVSGNPVERGAAVQRLKIAFDAFVRRGAEVDARLARNGREITSWLAEVKKQAFAASSFRSASLPQDQLERVLASPASGVEQRIGAAVALAALGPEQTARVRVAARSSVNERLRVALEAAASGEEEAAVYEAALADEQRAFTAAPR